MYARESNGNINLLANSYDLDGGKRKVFNVESVEFAINTWIHVALIYKNEVGNVWRLKMSVDSQDVQGPSAAPACHRTFKLGDADSQEPMSSFSIAEATIWYRPITETEIFSLYSSKLNEETASQPALKAVISQIKMEVMGESNLSDDKRLQLIKEFKRHRVIIANDRATMSDVLDLVELYERHRGDGLFLNPATKFGLNREGTSVDNLIFWVQQAALDFIYTSQVVPDCAISMLSGIKWKTARHFPGEVDPPRDPSLQYSVDVMATVDTFWGKEVRQTTARNHIIHVHVHTPHTTQHTHARTHIQRYINMHVHQPLPFTN